MRYYLTLWPEQPFQCFFPGIYSFGESRNRIKTRRVSGQIHMARKSHRISRALNFSLRSLASFFVPLLATSTLLPLAALRFLLVLWLWRWWGMLLLWLRGIQGGSDSSAHTHASMHNTDRCVADCIVETFWSPPVDTLLCVDCQFLTSRRLREVLPLSMRRLWLIMSRRISLSLSVLMCMNWGANCSLFTLN